MTDNELRVKIAEACGWRHFGCTGCNATPCRCTEWIHEDRGPCSLPDYLNNLNAMHEAERAYKLGDPDKYEEELERQTRKTGTRKWHATARQRALAFVQTIAAPPQVPEGGQEGK